MCLKCANGGGGEAGGTMRRDSWDPSQQIQGLKCPSQPNPNKNNIETCSVKLPKTGASLARDFVLRSFGKVLASACNRDLLSSAWFEADAVLWNRLLAGYLGFVFVQAPPLKSPFPDIKQNHTAF